MDTLQEFKNRNLFTIERTAYWGELDSLGHVNNTQYFRYFEDLRTTLYLKLFRENIPLANFNPVVAELTCQFLAPIFFPDTLLLGLSIDRIGNSSMVNHYEIFSLEQNRSVARGVDRIVNINPQELKKADIPEDFKMKFAPYLKQPTA